MNPHMLTWRDLHNRQERTGKFTWTDYLWMAGIAGLVLWSMGGN